MARRAADQRGAGAQGNDLDDTRGAIHVRHGKNDQRREAGLDQWGSDQLRPRLTYPLKLPVGALFCVIDGTTRGRHLAPAAVREQFRRSATATGVRRRFAAHQLRHAHAVEMAREGVPLIVIQRQLGYAHLGITSVYLQSIDNAEIINTVHAHRAPMICQRGPAPTTVERPRFIARLRAKTSTLRSQPAALRPE